MDSTTNSVHVLGQDFNDGDEKVVTHMLGRLIRANHQVNNHREWRGIKLHCCRGQRMGWIVRMAMKSSCQRFTIQSPSSNNEDHITTTFMPDLSHSLSLNTPTLTLCLHDVNLDATCIDLLRIGLETNTNLKELSFNMSVFSEDSIIDSLALLVKSWSTGEHLSFSGCSMSDEHCGNIFSALKDNHSLMELSLAGNSCKSIALNKLGDILPTTNFQVLDLSSQELEDEDDSRNTQIMDFDSFSNGLAHSRIRCLRLNENRLSGKNIQSIARSLWKNANLRILQLAWCDLSSPLAMSELCTALCHNQGLSTLVMYDCGITDEGISCFASRMHSMKGLKTLDIGGKQQFGHIGINAFAQGMQNSTEIEEVKIANHCPQLHQIQFFCDVNKGGRRYLKSQHSEPAALFPLVFERVEKIELPSCLDGLRSSYDSYDALAEDTQVLGKARNLTPSESERRLSIIYYLLRHAPILPNGNNVAVSLEDSDPSR